MSSYRYSSDDDDVNVRVSRRQRASPPFDYVESPHRRRPVSYYAGDQQAPYLVPEQTIIRTRSRSRERRRPSSASPPAAHGPVIINNRIYHDHSDEEDDYRQLQVAKASRQRSRSRGGDGTNYMTREEYEMERTRQQLDEMRLAQARDQDDRRAQGYRDNTELQRAKRELDEIKAREQRAKDEARIKNQLELERLREEEREEEEKERRKKEAKEAVERYKQDEAERAAKELKDKEQADKEYQRRLQAHLAKSGLDDKQIQAVMKGQRIPSAVPPMPPVAVGNELARPTYMRMSRRHLSIETLRFHHIDFEYDQDPDYVLIKRWVPEWEQDTLWRHTREVRDKRKLFVEVDDRKHERRSSRTEPQFEWVREKKKKSSDRRRSKSPGLLMYLAGARPA